VHGKLCFSSLFSPLCPGTAPYFPEQPPELSYVTLHQHLTPPLGRAFLIPCFPLCRSSNCFPPFLPTLFHPFPLREKLLVLLPEPIDPFFSFSLRLSVVSILFLLRGSLFFFCARIFLGGRFESPGGLSTVFSELASPATDMILF